MCARCEARELDPRHRAFKEIGFLDIIRKDNKVKPEGGDYVEVQAFDDPEMAQFKSYSMGSDPAIERVDFHTRMICLN